MDETGLTTPIQKQPGRFQNAVIRVTAVVTAATALVAALAGLLDGFGGLAEKVRTILAARDGPPVLAPPAPNPAVSPKEPATAPAADEAAERNRPTEHVAQTLFVAAPPGGDGEIVGARLRSVFQQEGFALAADRGAAGLVVEIAPPVFGPARTLPSSGLAITTIAATLQATVVPGTGTAPLRASPQQREVIGRGDGEEAARRDALSRAADQLSGRVVSTLRQEATSGAKP